MKQAAVAADELHTRVVELAPQERALLLHQSTDRAQQGPQVDAGGPPAGGRAIALGDRSESRAAQQLRGDGARVHADAADDVAPLHERRAPAEAGGLERGGSTAGA